MIPYFLCDCHRKQDAHTEILLFSAELPKICRVIPLFGPASHTARRVDSPSAGRYNRTVNKHFRRLPHEEAHPAASGLCRSGRTVFPCCLYRARRPARPRRGRADGRRRPCAHGRRRRGADRAGPALLRARPLLPPKKRRPSQLRFAEEFFLLMLLPPYLLTLTRGSTRP